MLIVLEDVRWMLMSSWSALASPGLVAAHELTRRGKKVAIVDQENEANLGGQAYWSFGGIFLVDSPEQRRLGVKDSFDLAWNDWQGSAAFDRLDGEDYWASRWARAYVEFAARRQARLPCRTRHQVPAHRGVGRTRRPQRRRPRQLGATLSHCVGHRNRHRRTVRRLGVVKPRPRRTWVTFHHRHQGRRTSCLHRWRR